MLRRSVTVLWLLLLSVFFLGARSFAQQPSAPDRLSGPIDVSQIVPLSGNVHPEALPKFDQGAVEPDFFLPRITMTLKPSPAQQTALNQLLADQQNPDSPRYHKWLTPEQYGARFGVSARDLAKIKNWLGSQGFTVLEVARSRNLIAFSGTAAQVQSGLHTEIHRYQVNGGSHFANATEPSIPQSLQGMVAGFRGLNDFRLHAMAHPAPSPRSMNLPVGVPYYTTQGAHYLAPDDIATIYDIKALYNASINGAGIKIVIVGQSDISLANVQNFRTIFGLPAINFSQIVVGTDPGPTSDEGEAYLDIEWSGAVAPNASIIYDLAHNAFDAAADAITNNRAPVISMSFGGCEPSEPPGALTQFETVLQQANTQGITFVAASGDTGAAGCDAGLNEAAATRGIAVNYPASSPEVTGVGGSTFNEGSGNFWSSTNSSNGGSALSYIPEMGWNDTTLTGTLTATGGGKSSCATQTSQGVCTAGFPKPSWQTGPGVPADGVRDVPDVTLAASPNHDGYIFCQSGLCSSGIPAPGSQTIIGGTSASAPIFAGIVTLLNQYLVTQHVQSSPGLGNINPKLYTLAAGSSGSTLFHDITSGNNIVPCQSGTPNCPASAPFQFGYSATAGYDLVTGLGSVDADALVTSWAATGNFTLTVAPTSLTITRGTPAHATFTLTASAGASNLPAMTLSCPSTLPITEASCSFSPATVVPTATGATSTLTITTKGPSGALRDPLGRGPQIFYALFLPGAFGAFFAAGRRKPGSRRLRVIGFGFLLLISVLWWTSCGGSSSHKDPGSTPVGQAVTINVTASATGFSQTTPLIVTLQ